MPHKRRIFRIFLTLALVLLLTLGVTAGAAEQLVAHEYIKITENGQAVDSLNGIEARYNLGGAETLWCTELVSRYYETLYGVTIYFGTNGPVARDTEEFFFQELPAGEPPQPGDVLYGPAALRGRSYNHWALVKAYDAYHETIQVIEQNWRYNGAAGVGRELEYPTPYYHIYRLYTADGEAQPALQAEDRASEAGKNAAALASKLGIAAVADGFQTGVRAGDFFTMCCNTVRAVAGSSSLAEPEDPVAAAVQLGLISAGSWQAGDTVLREQACVILTRLAMLLAPQPETDEAMLLKYPDSAEITPASRSYVARAFALGLMDGETLDPQGALTVEQALVSLTELACTPQRSALSPVQKASAPEAEPAVSALAADAAAALVGSLTPQG